MALSLDQHHALLIAERSRDVDVITAAVADVLAMNPGALLVRTRPDVRRDLTTSNARRHPAEYDR